MNERYTIADGAILRLPPHSDPYPIAQAMCDDESQFRVAELVRRANALPEVEAKLAEAVELLGRLYSWGMNEPEGVGQRLQRAATFEDARAFLEKVKVQTP